MLLSQHGGDSSHVHIKGMCYVQIKIYLESWVLSARHSWLTLVPRVGMYMGVHVHRKLVLEWVLSFASICRKSVLAEDVD